MGDLKERSILKLGSSESLEEFAERLGLAWKRLAVVELLPDCEPDDRLQAIAYKLGIEKEDLPGNLAAQIVTEIGRLQDALTFISNCQHPQGCRVCVVRARAALERK